MKRLLILLPLLAFVCAHAADRPNIVFIFSDDHAQHAISAYGSRVNRMPHIDRLARDGARFTRSFCINSICTPSRATLLTGQYSHVNGVPVFNRFDGARDHVAKHLQQGGDLGLYDKRFMYEPGLNVPLLARGPGIKAGITPGQFVSNLDLAPTFLELAGLPVPDFMQGRSLAPLLRGETPKDWHTSIYYRYYHSPGHHNTAAHLGVRTATHKLIHYWKHDAWELFDLAQDPTEQRNLLHCAADATTPEVAARFAELKAELTRLQKEFKDDGRYADPATWPKGEVDGPFDDKPATGRKTVAEAIALSVSPRL